MDIKVLGTGCYDCLRLELVVGQVLTELGMVADLTRIDDPRKIDRYVLSSPPGLVMDDQLGMDGRVPSREEITDWILAARDWERRGAQLN